MSGNKDISQPTKYGALGILVQNPLAANPSKDSCSDFIEFSNFFLCLR
jgi:hypothetical protein